MSEIIQIQEKFYVLASSSFADQQTRVLKEGDTFAVFNRYGDIQQLGAGQNGIYHEGTRFVSRLELRLGQNRPLLLSSASNESNTVLAVDLTNPDTHEGEKLVVQKGLVHIRRIKLLWQGLFYEQIFLENMGLDSFQLVLSLHWDADFTDIFEVRGFKRLIRGEQSEPNVGVNEVVLGYLGLDGSVRRSRFTVHPSPMKIHGTGAELLVSLAPKKRAVISLDVNFEIDEQRSRKVGFERALQLSEADYLRAAKEDFEIKTNNDQFNELLKRSINDLRMLATDTAYGPYPYAGIPWYSTVFGRDGIITALEMLAFNPSIAQGVLKYLARTQASEMNLEQEAEPGKIIHEVRAGEMAVLKEIPFGWYYGTVDATPLFILLAAGYFRRTGDLELVTEVWPNIERALVWIDEYGDLDHDGFVEYDRKTDRGLVNQGWKDSDDSVFHADGRLADGPIALCEVQSYVYKAKTEAALLADVLGKSRTAAALREQAAEMQRRFEQSFWLEELQCYALALDGEKKPCAVRTSNAGHALFAGIAAPLHAEVLTHLLMSPEFFCGWGLRTVSARESRYSPISYHNGSVWPHDNAMIACGFAEYGYKEEALRVLTALFDVSLYAGLRRLPELYCGFDRQPGLGPTFYPVACSPQAWAAGSVFLALQACLGLKIDGGAERVEFSRPSLPPFVTTLEIKNLRVGESVLDLTCQRYARDFGINVDRREGRAGVVIYK